MIVDRDFEGSSEGASNGFALHLALPAVDAVDGLDLHAGGQSAFDQRVRQAARVVAVNWGPWESGMVSDELRKMYESREMYLIPIQDGVDRMEQELRMNGQARPEVLISCSVPVMLKTFCGVGDTRRGQE